MLVIRYSIYRYYKLKYSTSYPSGYSAFFCTKFHPLKSSYEKIPKQHPLTADGIIINKAYIEVQAKLMEELTYKKLIKFYLPLIISSSSIMLTHIIINNALGKLYNPDLFISSYNTSRSMVMIFQSIGMCLSVVFASFTVNEKTYIKVKRYSIATILIIAVLLISIVFTPLSRLIFSKAYNLKGDLLEKSIITAKFICFFSISVSIRTFFVGIAIKLKYNPLISAASFMRLIMVFILNLMMGYLVQKINTDFIPGFLLMMCGVTEMAVIVLSIWIYSKDIKGKIVEKCIQSPYYDKDEDVTYRQIFYFALPVILSMVLRVLVPSVTNSALALSYNAEKVIAAYSIAMIVNQFVAATLMNFRLVAISHDSLAKENKRIIRNFVFSLGVFGAVFVAIAAFTPFGEFALINVLNALPDTAVVGKTALIFLILNPIFLAYEAYYYGYLLKIRKTKMITFQRLIASLIPYALFLLVPIVSWEFAAALGAAAVTLGSLSAGIFNHLAYKYSYKQYKAELAASHSDI